MCLTSSSGVGKVDGCINPGMEFTSECGGEKRMGKKMQKEAEAMSFMASRHEP